MIRTKEKAVPQVVGERPASALALLTLFLIAMCGVGCGPNRVWAWGDNENGQLGDGTVMMRPVPIELSNPTDVTALAALSHSLALASDGRVWAFGLNTFGE